jgi:adenosine deaminase
MGSRYLRHPIHTIMRESIPFVLGTDSPAVHSTPLSAELSLFLSAYGNLRDLASTFDAGQRFAFDPEAFKNAIPRNPIRELESAQNS